ncbi:SDR family oxidoreductase [Pontibacillus litoralis]|uniref:Thioester reductase (TE) domain-containing protein n=1 Tax=Pontibacillus litoralis JSM 072002 TaxID=1385512 RepID=A0A0A5G0E7_9BACI|nr:SDR family oxidoreductase [Pontibacillus litoralis]KGX86576.1 hypothetical protein N784_04165 [Pontibacillus litoralis JSM 072002]
MKPVYFFTGFPGFITNYLIEELLYQQYPFDKMYLLALPEHETIGTMKIQSLCHKYAVSPDHFELVLGDITKRDLNLDRMVSHNLLTTITHAYHLAALYDLSIPLQPAYHTNVKGTKHVNEWLQDAIQLQHYTYFSTAYVAGKRPNVIYENDLEHEYGFKNYYEATKYQAEMIVREQLGQLPTTIIRPSIVIGHSETGEIPKFDGPYFILNLLDRLKLAKIIPYFGKGNAEANFVPVDYVVKATIYLSHLPQSIGRTYHLSDPSPYTIQQVYKMLSETFVGRTPTFTLPIQAAQVPLNVRPIRKWLHVQKQALPYFIHDCHFDTSHAKADLLNTSITCPDFRDIVPNIIDFYNRNKYDDQKQITIV